MMITSIEDSNRLSNILYANVNNGRFNAGIVATKNLLNHFPIGNIHHQKVNEHYVSTTNEIIMLYVGSLSNLATKLD